MRDILLSQGVAAPRILLECAARDSLESVPLCTRLLRSQPDVGRVLVSTGSYHRLCCALLFKLAGFDSVGLPTASDRPYLGWGKWLRHVLKKLNATPWDAAWLLLHRFRRTIMKHEDLPVLCLRSPAAGRGSPAGAGGAPGTRSSSTAKAGPLAATTTPASRPRSTTRNCSSS